MSNWIITSNIKTPHCWHPRKKNSVNPLKRHKHVQISEHNFYDGKSRSIHFIKFPPNNQLWMKNNKNNKANTSIHKFKHTVEKRFPGLSQMNEFSANFPPILARVCVTPSPFMCRRSTFTNNTCVFRPSVLCFMLLCSSMCCWGMVYASRGDSPPNHSPLWRRMPKLSRSGLAKSGDWFLCIIEFYT